MFEVTLHLPVETLENVFVAPVNIQTIEAFMNRVGYQGVVDKVSVFYINNLAQPWQTMFKVFNRYLTTRTSRHDQTKINILQLFHAVINRKNVDYATLLWTVSKVPGLEETIKFMLNTQQFVYTVDMFRDILQLLVETLENPFVAPLNMETIETFINRVDYQGVVDKMSAFYTKNLAQPWQTMFKDFMNNVKQKKEAIQYPRLIKLIIADLMNKFPEIPKRIREDYHSIKDDIPLEIRATDDFKEYETGFMNVDVLMNQLQPDVSTQGTHRSTPRAHRTPTLTASPQGKKRKQSAGESSSPQQSHKITIRRKRQSTTSIPPPGDDKERDEVAEATILSLTLHKTDLPAKAQENIAKVQEKLDEEEIEKMVEGDEDEYTRKEPEIHKENLKNVNDDDVEIVKEKKDDVEFEKEKKDDVEIEKGKKAEETEKDKNDDNVEKTDEIVMEKNVVDDVKGSMEIRKEQKQTPIPSPTRSLRNVSSFNKTIYEELTTVVSPTTATTSKIREVLNHCNKVVPDKTFAKTSEMIKQEMPRLVNLAVNKDHEVDPINAKEMIANEFATHGPKMIEELL
ncbi:hypothetical protein Tco_1132145 [Tanacetum coccineum]|uniref:Uncharacterized protein n=1 Tax=Tanacetum coccineum TaxID=301880 RepID=A0ABQ5JF71_9ASTR